MENLRNFLTILKNECKIVFRTKIFYVVLLPLMYFLYYSIFDGITSLTFSGYVVQILILVSMLIGYQNSVREEKENCLELLSLAKNRYTACLCKLLATEFYLLFLNICLIMVVILFGSHLQTASWIMKEAVWYMVLYFGISSIIGGLIGFLVGVFGRYKISYLILLFLGVAIGPLGKEFLELFGTLLHIPVFRNLAGIITVGQYDATQGFNYLYGFEIESKRFFHRVCYMLILFLVWQLVFWWKEHNCYNRTRKVFKSVIITVALLVVVFIQFKNPCYVQKTGHMEDSAQNLYDLLYYGEKESTNEAAEWKLNKVNIDVDTQKQLSVKGSFEGEMVEKTDTVHFTLYHDFKVNSIKMDTQALTFEQKDDVVTVSFGKALEKGEAFSLELSYDGLVSPYYFAGEKGVYLPAEYNWLPYPGQSYSMVEKENFVEANPLVVTDTVEYELHYAGTHMLCTNLEKNGDVYTGKSSAGVSLVSGHLKETKAGSAKVYYTYDYSESFASKQTEQLIKMVKDLRSKLGMDETPVKQVFLVPTKNKIIGYCEGKTSVFEDSIVTGMYPVTEEEQSYLQEEALMGILSSQSYFVSQERDIQESMIEAILKAYKKQDDATLKQCKEQLQQMENEFSDK